MRPTGPARMTRAAAIFAASLLLNYLGAPSAAGYVFNFTVGDLRQSAAQSGGTACPQRNRFHIATPGGVNRRWSTSLGANPVTILTLDQTPAGRLNEIESVIQDSFAAWANVGGSALRPAALAPLARISAQAACSSADGLNTICFGQNDLQFTLGVLAFTRVVTADAIGQQLSTSQPASNFIGQIMDADILVRPDDASATFATPAALPNQPNAYDLESVLTHELGHFFGFGHSAVWRAIMYPYVPERGQFLADRPSPGALDAPLAEDDRTGVRALYPDSADTNFVGTISGRILPANTLALAGDPAAPTGIFGAQVVAVDDATGSVVAATISGWSCSNAGPPSFDGSYAFERLPVAGGRSYRIYAESLDGTVGPGEIAGSLGALCRNQITDPGWPPSQACILPAAKTNFSARVRP
jgi:matrixin